jgi:hypothetical protein
MAKTPRTTQYDEPRIYWAFCPLGVTVYPVIVVAESEHCLWIKPTREFDRFGRPHRPVLRRKGALCTFHTFHEAKRELMERLASETALAKKNVERVCALYEAAVAIQPPQERAT